MITIIIKDFQLSSLIFFIFFCERLFKNRYERIEKIMLKTIDFEGAKTNEAIVDVNQRHIEIILSGRDIEYKGIKGNKKKSIDKLIPNKKLLP